MNVAAEGDLLFLFSKIADGDEKAFTDTFNRCHDAVFSTALQYCKSRQLAEDVVQQVFMALWHKRAALKEIENGAAWLWAITRNQAISALKKEGIRESYIIYVKELFQGAQETPLHQLELRQKRDMIDRAINSLPPRQQQVYRMSRYEGATYAQIGEALSIGTETVKEHMAKALKTIRRLLLAYKNDVLLLVIFLLY